MDTDEVLSPKKRGRKPVGDVPMTAAERKKASRAKKAEVGEKEFMVTLRGPTLHYIEGVARAGNISKAQVVTMLLELVIDKVYAEVSVAHDQIDRGEVTQQVAEQRLFEMLRAPAAPVSMATLFGEASPQPK